MSKPRYEREIEEILSRYEQDKAQKEKQARQERPPIDFRGNAPSRPPSRPSNVPGMPNWKRLSSGQYMLAAFGVAILALLLSGIARPISMFLVILAAVLFLVPILLYWTTGTSSGGYSPREERRWRGQVIDFSTRRDITNDPFATIKRWFRRR